MTDGELQELVQRQKKVLGNSKIVDKLRDHGQKLRQKLVAAEEEMSRRAAAVAEIADELERMSMAVEDSPGGEHDESSSLSSDEHSFPKFCAKLEKLEQHRNVKTKFKPFSTTKEPIRPTAMKSDVTATWKSYPNLQPGPPRKEIPALSLHDSLKIAALQQTLSKNFYREDASQFSQDPVSGAFLSETFPSTDVFSKHRDNHEDSDNEDDAPPIEHGKPIVGGLEDLD
ncbi:uncharacterized protein LOC100900524 [Galendromus occidentalis]|uniref:Uncharacterized protein LOC100900524 n=1 Tax=Galendromus occidentalis TaxID=34638 RepID=A0AAJ6VW02_9ACAR|nr:uncharacterized protein LOC100900524 [Galendromus occidentalis]